MPDQINASDLSGRARVVDGLRQLADYLDQHPAVPVNEYGCCDLAMYAHHRTDAEGMAAVDQVAAIAGVQVRDEIRDGGHYIAAKSFEPISYRMVRVPERRRAAYAALMSYRGSVMPDASAKAASPHVAPRASGPVLAGGRAVRD